MVNSAAYAGDLSEGLTCHAVTHRSDRPCGTAAHPCPVEKARKMIGYEPKWPLEKGFVEYINWYKSMAKNGKEGLFEFVYG